MALSARSVEVPIRGNRLFSNLEAHFFGTEDAGGCVESGLLIVDLAVVDAAKTTRASDSSAALTCNGAICYLYSQPQSIAIG